MIANKAKFWSGEAKNLTFQAINKAGFTKRYFRRLRNIIFVTEQEAAALYSIKYFMAGSADDLEDVADAADADDEFVQVCSSYQMASSSAELISPATALFKLI
jgi:hypothetical protein